MMTCQCKMCQQTGTHAHCYKADEPTILDCGCRLLDISRTGLKVTVVLCKEHEEHVLGIIHEGTRYEQTTKETS